MFRYIRHKVLGASKKHVRPNTARCSRPLRMEGLEVRQMMTGGLVSAYAPWYGNRFASFMAPAAPSFTATPVSGTQINLSWQSVPRANGYLVDEWINGAWRQIANWGTGSGTYTVSSLTRRHHLLF